MCTLVLGMLAVWHRGLFIPPFFLSIARPLPLSLPLFSSCSELMLIILALIDGPVRSPGWPSYSDVAAVAFWVTFFNDSENQKPIFNHVQAYIVWIYITVAYELQLFLSRR
jgi:hypothetical protein